MTRYALVLAAAMLLTTRPLAQTSSIQFDPALFRELQWRNIGPHRASRTEAIEGVESEPHTFYMGVVNGGVWKTTDARRTWRPIFDDQPTGCIGTIAVAPSNPNVIYVGAGEAQQRPDLSSRLTVDGRVLTKPLVVKMDPRVKASPDDLRLQYQTSRAIDALLRRSSEALAEIRKMPARSPAVTEVEQRLTRTSQPLGQLFNLVEQADAAPTPLVIETWKTASTAVQSVLTEWEKVRTRKE